MIVVDSSVWIANLRGDDRPSVRHLTSVLDPATVIVGDIVLLEVLRGTRDDRQASSVEQYLRRFYVVSMLSADIAAAAAGHYRSLRRLGITLSKIPDLLIATFCVANDYELLHDDRDFDPLVARMGLRVAAPEHRAGH